MYKFIFIFQWIHLGPQKHFSLSPHFFTNTDSFNPHTSPINGALHYPHLTDKEMVETLSNLHKATQRGSQDSNLRVVKIQTRAVWHHSIWYTTHCFLMLFTFKSKYLLSQFQMKACLLSPETPSPFLFNIYISTYGHWFPIIK